MAIRQRRRAGDFVAHLAVCARRGRSPAASASWCAILRDLERERLGGRALARRQARIVGRVARERDDDVGRLGPGRELHVGARRRRARRSCASGRWRRRRRRLVDRSAMRSRSAGVDAVAVGAGVGVLAGKNVRSSPSSVPPKMPQDSFGSSERAWAIISSASARGSARATAAHHQMPCSMSLGELVLRRVPEAGGEVLPAAVGEHHDDVRRAVELARDAHGDVQRRRRRRRRRRGPPRARARAGRARDSSLLTSSLRSSSERSRISGV